MVSERCFVENNLNFSYFAMVISDTYVHTLISDPDGKERQIYYKADKNGYQVSYDSKL